MLKPLVRVISAAIVIDLLATVQSQADDKRCVPANDAQNLLQKASCWFTRDLCGWQSGVNVQWKATRVDHVDGGDFYYSFVNSIDLPANSSTRLVSPWLCASEHGVFSLSFSYYLPINSPERCRLSVLLSVGDNVRPLKVWTATSATGTSSYRRFLLVSPISISCKENPFQIYFEAEKLSNTSCGEFHEIGIHNLRIAHSTTFEGTFVTCPSLPSPASDASKADDDGCLGGGAVAGIAIGVIVFVVIVIVFIVFISRRGWSRENVLNSSVFKFFTRSPRQNSRSTDEPQAASNAGFDQYEPTPGPDTASRGIHSDYELASDPADHYSTPHTAPDRAAVNAGTRGQHGDASSSYNELSFEAQPPKQGARTYDHLKQ